MEGIATRIAWIGIALGAISCGDDANSTVSSTSSALGAADSVDLTDYEPVPGGWLMHKSCIHQVPSGSRVSQDSAGAYRALGPDGVEVVFPACAYKSIRASGQSTSTALPPPSPTYNDYAEWSETTAPNNGGRKWFNKIVGEWTVPSNPTDGSALLYFFNGLVDKITTNHTVIIQPVLMWNPTNRRWQIASFWVGAEVPNGTMMSAPVNVATDNLIRGETSSSTIPGLTDGCTTSGVCDWQIITSHGTDSTFLFVSATNAVYQRAYQGVMETYYMTSCNNFPSSGYVLFQHTYLYQPPPTGNQNTQVEMYNSTTWTPIVNSNWTGKTACSLDHLSVLNADHGTTLNF